MSAFDDNRDHLDALADALGRGQVERRPGDVPVLAIPTKAGLLEIVDPGEDIPVDLWLDGQPILLGDSA